MGFESCGGGQALSHGDSRQALSCREVGVSCKGDSWAPSHGDGGCRVRGVHGKP